MLVELSLVMWVKISLWTWVVLVWTAHNANWECFWHLCSDVSISLPGDFSPVWFSFLCYFFFFFNKSVDCCFTQGVDSISTDLLLALKSCSLARALTFSNTIPSFKGIYYCSKPVSLLFADFTQVHVHKTVI